MEADAGEDALISSNSGDVTLRNNLFLGGSQQIYVSAYLEYAINLHLYNNTFVDAESFQIGGYGYSAHWSSFSFHDNIIAGMSDPSVYVFEIFYYSNVNYGCSDWVPVPFRANIGYDMQAAGWVECVSNDLGNQWDDSIYDYGDDAQFGSGFTGEDPAFVTSPGRGTFALDPLSPAVDAGMGDPDPDGSPNDLGAFGGPDGNWWMEVPWLD